MHNYSYEEIENLQETVSKKIMAFIERYLDQEDLLDSVDFHYPDFDDQKSERAFRFWIATDYKTKYNKSFIELMLEEIGSKLSPLEVEILKKRNSSHISLYEVEDIVEETIIAKDLITGKSHRLSDPKSINVVKRGDLVFTRVVDILGEKCFFGSYSLLPKSLKKDFLNDIKIDYSRERLKDFYLSIEDYLKNFSLNIYKIYTDLVYEMIQSDEEEIALLYDELDHFENYLETKLGPNRVKEYLDNVMDFFEYYLIDKELRLEDLYKVDVKCLAQKAITKGYINSKEEFISYINALKIYLKYLQCIDKRYKATYLKLIDIANSPFKYFDLLNSTDKPFEVNKRVSMALESRLSEKAFSLIMDLDRFLLFILEDPVSLNEDLSLKKSMIDDIDELLDNSLVDRFDYESQWEHPIINLFFNFAMDKAILEDKKGFAILTERGNQFLRLRDEDKFILLLEYTLGPSFFNKIYSQDLYIDREIFLDHITGLRDNIYYKPQEVIPIRTNIWDYYIYLNIMDMVDLNYTSDLSVKVSSLGRFTFNLLKDSKESKTSGKLIFLDKYKEAR